jgi:hypothetical protein
MAHTATDASSIQRKPHAWKEIPIGELSEPNDDFDFPPTAHPGRELFTFSLFALSIITIVVWGCWKLLSLAFPLS